MTVAQFHRTGSVADSALAELSEEDQVTINEIAKCPVFFEV